MIFFSKHRGVSVRLLLEFKDENKHLALTAIRRQIEGLLADSKQPILPGNNNTVRCFFQDFDTHELHYNLFNAEIMLKDARKQQQIVLSEIMLQFFTRHAPDDNSIFQFIVVIFRQTLNYLFDVENDFGKYDCLHTIASHLKIRSEQSINSVRSFAQSAPSVPVKNIQDNAAFKNQKINQRSIELEMYKEQVYKAEVWEGEMPEDRMRKKVMPGDEVVEPEYWKRWQATIDSLHVLYPNNLTQFNNVASIMEHHFSHLDQDIIRSAILHLETTYYKSILANKFHYNP
ncbi:MAG: hypothetical protein EOP48_07650 [Sphingobacteriales bacterium]|nr:MAG: hypothetical protein EOP48_07650 [Sphingobacteriales bacterium]